MGNLVIATLQMLPNMPDIFPKDIGHSSDLDLKKKKRYAGLSHKPDGLWNKVADDMLIIFAESGHPVFR